MIKIRFQNRYSFPTDFCDFFVYNFFAIFVHFVQKIGCTSEKNSNKFDSFSLGFSYFCKLRKGFYKTYKA